VAGPQSDQDAAPGAVPPGAPFDGADQLAAPASVAAGPWDAGAGGMVQDALEMISGIVSVVELTPIAAVRSFDRGGAVRFWNKACADLYGIAPEQALGRPHNTLLSHEVQRAAYEAAVAEVWSSGQPCPSRDWQVRSVSGATVWIYSTMFPVFRGGQLDQIFCMDIDITERKQQESTLLAVGLNFRQLFEKSSDAIVLIRDDLISEVNPSMVALFECGEGQRMVGRRLSDFAPLQQSGGGASALLHSDMAEQAYRDGNRRYEWRYVTCLGTLFWAEVLLTAVSIDHEHLFYAVIRDISARKQAEQSLHLAAQVFENGRDAMLVTDAQRHIVTINRAYTDITGYSAAEAAGQPIAIYRDGAPDEALTQRIWFEVAATDHWQGEIWGRRRNGALYPAWLALTVIRDSAGEVSNYMGILSDITERKRTEQHTRHMAEHDFLTDLPNRVLLLDRLSLALVAAHRKHSMLAILFLDLDHFKNINDTMGHAVGDLLLQEVARRLIRCVRGVDTVSRQGGDEFLIILADIGGVDQAAHVASTVLHAVSQVYLINGYELHVSASIGVSIYPSDGDDIDTLVKNADIAMYHAKESGRNSFQFFDSDMNARIGQRVLFENGLRHALDADQFELAYQPAVDIASGRIVGAEALIRWRHPELGLLLPERFIGVAEESGLMIAIGNWVLRHACRQARGWADGGVPLVVAINLSAAQFMQKNLLQSIADALAEAGLDAGLLELEITEAILMKNENLVGERLAALHALGVRLAIDDFGTGYSRLGQLRNYPVDKLKIDRSFMADIGPAADDSSVITTIIAMARSLHLRVIAEGVETADQLEFLRAHGCDEYQGHYAGTAMHGSELTKLLQ
jgi:diguanylate cyclase (GGDEF)-like protein/PAS domain S-box-containing protein